MFAYCLNNPVSNKDDNGFLCFYMSDGGGGSRKSYQSSKSTSDWINRGSFYGMGGYSVVASRNHGYIHAVKNGTKAHTGKVVNHGRVGSADTFTPKSKYVLGEVTDEFKGTVKKAGLISIGINGVSNYIQAGGFNKEFAVGWAVDCIADVVIGLAATCIVAIGVTFVSATLPVWATVAAGVAVSGVISNRLEGPLDKLKDSIISEF
jgi:hypothetical protein